MCIILEKLPGKEIPYEHLLASACRNDDGYGVVVYDSGTLTLVKGMKKDPEESAKEVQRILDDAKTNHAFAHFRLSTFGDKIIENVQPVQIFSKNKGDEQDLFFMHNGTLNSYKRKGAISSDSIIFSREFVEPLLRRSQAYLGSHCVLEDPLVAEVLSRMSDWSRFCLVDSYGKNLIINRKSGEEQDYGWISNGYSIDEKNIEKSKNRSSKTYTFGTQGNSKDKVTGKLQQQMDYNFNKPFDELQVPPNQRTTIEEATGFELEDFKSLDHYQILDMVKEVPELGALLILDLLHKLDELENYND